MQLDLATLGGCERLIMGYVQGKVVQAAMGQGAGSSPQTRTGVKPPLSAEEILFWGQPEGQGPSGSVLHPLELYLTAC